MINIIMKSCKTASVKMEDIEHGALFSGNIFKYTDNKEKPLHTLNGIESNIFLRYFGGFVSMGQPRSNWSDSDWIVRDYQELDGDLYVRESKGN